MSCGKKTISLKIFLGSRFSVYCLIPPNAFFAALSFTKSRRFVKSHNCKVIRPPAFWAYLALIVVIFVLTCQPGFCTSLRIYEEITGFKYINNSGQVQRDFVQSNPLLLCCSGILANTVLITHLGFDYC